MNIEKENKEEIIDYVYLTRQKVFKIVSKITFRKVYLAISHNTKSNIDKVLNRQVLLLNGESYTSYCKRRKSYLWAK